VTPHIDATTTGLTATERGLHSCSQAREGTGRVREDPRRDAVDAGDVNDRVHHRHVRRADVGARIARRDRGDHQLRHTDWKRPHRARGNTRAAGTAERTDGVESALGVEPTYNCCCTAAHRLDGRGAIASVGERLHVRPGRRRHLLASHVVLDQRLAEDAGVDNQHVGALLADAIGEEPVLPPLRVERPDQDNNAADVAPYPSRSPSGSLS
jgi:hypothetical protein